MTTAQRNNVAGGFQFAEYTNSAGSGIVSSQSAAPVDDVLIPLAASRISIPDDNGRMFTYNSAGAITFTIDLNMSSGFGFAVVQKNAGAVTIAGAAGVTITNISGFTKTSGIGSVIGIIQTGKNEYSLVGQGA